MLRAIKISGVKWGHVGISETQSSGPYYFLWFHQDTQMMQCNASGWAAVGPRAHVLKLQSLVPHTE